MTGLGVEIGFEGLNDSRSDCASVFPPKYGSVGKS